MQKWEFRRAVVWIEGGNWLWWGPDGNTKTLLDGTMNNFSTDWGGNGWELVSVVPVVSGAIETNAEVHRAERLGGAEYVPFTAGHVETVSHWLYFKRPLED